MNSKLLALAAAASALALGAAGSANAAVFVDGGVGGHLTYHLHNTGDATAPTVRLDVQGEDFLVDLSATTGGLADDLNQGGAGSGFAIVNGTDLFDTITLDPFNFDGFDKLQFFLAYQQKTVNPTAPPPNLNISYGSYTLAYTLVAGGGGSMNVNIENGNQRFQLFGDAGEQFKTVTLSNLKGTAQDGNGPVLNIAPGFENIRQMSFEATVGSAAPEPAAWAMMIMGFGGVGAMIRRRRTLTA